MVKCFLVYRFAGVLLYLLGFDKKNLNSREIRFVVTALNFMG